MSQQYDYLNRLSAISNAPSAGLAVSYSYGYNAANQRIRCTLADGSYWLYQYDALGQLQWAHKFWADETPVAGQQFDYAFDDIGNRKSTETGGDPHGWNQRAANYSVNDLNQYTSRDVPGKLEILGVSFATNTVTVNGNTAYRKGEYFWNELGVNNDSAPLWEAITVAATGQSSVSGNKFVPKTPEQFGYDSDGNLSSDGRWNYTWDAENRLVQMVSDTTVGPQQLIKFGYDAQGRRIQKQVWDNTSGSGNPVIDERFLYDGWNLIAVLSSSSHPLSSYLWGNDLSGSPQGAGGVGGLLEVTYDGSSTTNCFVAFDGNGNVAALVNAADGSIVGNYEYGPFGELLRATGPMAKANPFRFSTKYQDDESDLLYYGYRYYDSSMGRWLSRDPINEIGYQTEDEKLLESINLRLSRWHLTEEKNLYCLTFNRPINEFDILGLSCGKCGPDVTDFANSLLRNVDETFQNAGFIKQCTACEAMYQLPIAEIDWDIGLFYHYGYPGPDEPPCNHTFTYGGDCYWAGSLNYLLWGDMNRLCRYSLQKAEFFVWLWKEHNPLEHPANIEILAQAFEMTQDGYEQNYGSQGGLNCDPNKVKEFRDDTDWKWWPITGWSITKLRGEP